MKYLARILSAGGFLLVGYALLFEGSMWLVVAGLVLATAEIVLPRRWR